MITVLIILASFNLIIFVRYFNRKAHFKLNSVAVMVYIWTALLLMASLWGEKMGFYPLDVSCVFFCFLFLTIIVFTANAVIVRKPLMVSYEDDAIIRLNESMVFKIAVIAFLLYMASNIFYFRDLSKHIPLSNLMSSLWRWKDLVLTGRFSERSISYIGRNISFIGLILSVNFIRNMRSTFVKKVVSTFMLTLYVAITFLNPRRDPMIDKMVYVIVPFFYAYRTNMKKILRILIPLGIVFSIAFVIIADSMSFGNLNIVEMVGRYTFAPFNSMQKALDYGYEFNSSLPLSNTFYFVYMVLKFLFPQLTPPSIVLEGMGGDTGNIYTSLIAPLIDSNGSLILFVVFLIFYAVYIGIINGVAINMLNRQTLPGYVFYAAVFACAVRSFYNPTFSYAEVLFGAFYAALLSLLMPKFKAKDL